MTSLIRALFFTIFALTTTSSFAGEVRTRKYPIGVLLTLERRVQLANSANANAHPYFVDASLDRKDLESFQDGCFYVTETQKILSAVDLDLRSREAAKALRDRSKQFGVVKRAMESGMKIRKLCRAHDPSRSGELMQVLTEQRTLIADLRTLIP